METNEICNSRFPQKVSKTFFLVKCLLSQPQLLKFYESNLKWKGADDDF